MKIYSSKVVATCVLAVLSVEKVRAVNRDCEVGMRSNSGVR